MHFPRHKAPGSGAQGLIGYEIDLTAPDGSARITLDLRDEHLNRNQTLHGGIHAMMLDAAAGFAASRLLADGGPELVPVVTLTLTTSFIAPARLGQVIVTGRVTGGGRKVVYGEANIVDADGRMCSTASGVFKRVTIS